MNSESFLRKQLDDYAPLSKPSDYLKDYLDVLSGFDEDYKYLKPEWINTKYDFIEGIRCELKNKITKINKELATPKPKEQD